MSDKSVNELFNETKSKLNGYAMLFYFHLANICIKADPLALLSTTVEVDGAEPVAALFLRITFCSHDDANESLVIVSRTITDGKIYHY